MSDRFDCSCLAPIVTVSGRDERHGQVRIHGPKVHVKIALLALIAPKAHSRIATLHCTTKLQRLDAHNGWMIRAIAAKPFRGKKLILLPTAQSSDYKHSENDNVANVALSLLQCS